MVRVAIGPPPAAKTVIAAVEAAGGVVSEPSRAEVMVWQKNPGPDLIEALEVAPGVKWVQLLSAGVDALFDGGFYSPRHIWTCAKGGQMGRNVAEMAMLMLLSAAREFHRFARADEWLPEAGRPLAGSKVAIIGGGGIGRALLRMLTAFEVNVTVVKREVAPMIGAAKVVPIQELDSVLGDADAIVLAVPLTRETRGLMDARRLALLRPHAWLINVARGRLVDTAALVAALESRALEGAGLDVVEPEPLPREHPLWKLPNVILTPHVANTRAMAPDAVSGLLKENIERWVSGQELLGVVDGERGY
jgi:phosphoglycerate dehydrogenase-like enzyme